MSLPNNKFTRVVSILFGLGGMRADIGSKIGFQYKNEWSKL
jgi:hypothetical protein